MYMYMYMYIFMYMLLDITAAPENGKIEKKIKYIVVRNCLSKDMDRRIARRISPRLQRAAADVRCRRQTRRHSMLAARRRPRRFASSVPFRYLKSRQCAERRDTDMIRSRGFV